MLDVVDDTVSSSFGSDEASTPVKTLTSKHTGKLIPELLVCTKEETNLASTGTNIAGCNARSMIRSFVSHRHLRGNEKKVGSPGTSVSFPMCR